ncbi:MAG: M23 family metallopeptidase [Candidatus Omnitrophota bacterium]
MRSFVKYTIIVCLIILALSPLYPRIFKKIIILKEPFYTCPLSGMDELKIRSDTMGKGHFGARRSGGRRKHKGIDLVGDVGDPVAAAKSGIAKTGEVLRGMGKYIKITHPDNSFTVYGHLSAVSVENESWVWQGEKIGEIGKTGNAYYPNMDPHLHFEIRIDNEQVDPEPHLNLKR